MRYFCVPLTERDLFIGKTKELTRKPAWDTWWNRSNQHRVVSGASLGH